MVPVSPSRLHVTSESLSRFEQRPLPGSALASAGPAWPAGLGRVPRSEADDTSLPLPPASPRAASRPAPRVPLFPLHTCFWTWRGGTPSWAASFLSHTRVLCLMASTPFLGRPGASARPAGAAPTRVCTRNRTGGRHGAAGKGVLRSRGAEAWGAGGGRWPCDLGTPRRPRPWASAPGGGGPGAGAPAPPCSQPRYRRLRGLLLIFENF